MVKPSTKVTNIAEIGDCVFQLDSQKMLVQILFKSSDPNVLDKTGAVRITLPKQMARKLSIQIRKRTAVEFKIMVNKSQEKADAKKTD